MPACQLVVVGGSWGGTEAVGRLLADLPPTFSLPVVVALHRSPGSSEEMLVKSLSRASKLRIVEPDDKTALERGQVYVAPADYHILVEEDHVALSVDPPERFSRPSIDVLFESAAEAYGDGLIAVILTGANDDGARGIATAKMLGARTFVQDPATAERDEMPNAAIATGAVDRVLPIHAIAAAIAALDAPHEADAP